MMKNQRPSPEEFLQRARTEELDKRRGKLKIFLGAAPGVGKTWAMLHDAMDKRARDLDVVIGVIESHGREEIESLLSDFEVIPKQTVQYRGKTCMELDLNAILKRQPGLILIDEMAHTNAPGLPHAKRWQDINELLERGIDVYTTLNVQHIESLKDDIARIIQAPIGETVPDSIIEQANTIALVDLPPEDLLKRLNEGKVYIPKQAELATEHFFRKGNLIALREFALRAAAERVRADVLLYRKDEGIKRVWPTRDKILVCVGPQPGSLNLIRVAKRIATSLHAEWIAVYVDRLERQTSVNDHNKAMQNLRQAEILGAKTYVLSGLEIARTIADFAHEQNVTQIIVRKRILARWMGWFSRSLADEIVRHSGEIDVFVITRDTHSTPSSVERRVSPGTWKTWVITVGIVAWVTILNIFLGNLFSPVSLMMIYLLGVIVIAWQGQALPVIFGSILSVLAYDFFFIPEAYRFDVTNFQYFSSLVVMFFLSQIIGYLTTLTRRQTELARMNQRQATALYTFSRQLTATRGVDNLLALGTGYLVREFNCEVDVLLPHKSHGEVRLECQSDVALDIKEKGIAQWVYEMGLPAGLGTDTLSSSSSLYCPVVGSENTLGVLRIKPRTDLLFTPEQLGLMDSCIKQLAMALEVERFHEREQREALKHETERVRSILLLAIANDLGKPLAMVVGVAGQLNQVKDTLVQKMAMQLDTELARLSHLHHNIIHIMALESGKADLKKSSCSIEEIITLATEITCKSLRGKLICRDIPLDIPRVTVDRGLLQVVFVNLFDHMIVCTARDCSVYVYVRVYKNRLMVYIQCHEGVPVEPKLREPVKARQLETFVKERGMGLGLSICKEIIEVHGGRMWVEGVEDEHVNFRFTLPL